MDLLTVLLIIPGIYLLVKGANLFVDSASSLALRFKIKPIVIGLTIVAFGTSFPELSVNLLSALNGNTDIALGNVVGSNIANILLILGFSALFTKLSIEKNTTWKEIPLSFLGALFLLLFVSQQFLDSREFNQIVNLNSENFFGSITFTHGIVLLLVFVIFLYYTFDLAKGKNDDSTEIKDLPLNKSILLTIAGLVMIIFGGKFTVDSAVIMATMFGVSESLIALTIVAVGTSLPELVTSVVAARKGQGDIALGNVVGSNIFNIFFILGITATVKSIPVNFNNLLDILFLLIVTISTFLSILVMEKYRLGKKEGVAMLSLYIFYTIYLIHRG
jgi:cation:H+ antiporter